MVAIEGFTTAPGVVAPHELLGLMPHERDPIRIVEAARLRLRAIERSGGSDQELRSALSDLIRRARDLMLREVRTPGATPTRESGGGAGGTEPAAAG